MDGVTQGTGKEDSKQRRERKQPRLEPQGNPWAEDGQREAGEGRGKSREVQVQEQSRGETTPAPGRRRCPGGMAERGGTVSRPGPDSLATETYVPWLPMNTRAKSHRPDPEFKKSVFPENARDVPV